MITGFDDQPVDGPRSLQELVERSTIGKQHRLSVLRDGKPVTLTVSVKPLPDKLAQRSPSGSGLAEEGGKTFHSEAFGLAVTDKHAVAEDAYEGFDGVLVERVDPDGVAAEAGIGPGVLIRKVGKTPVVSVADFEAAIKKESPEEGVVLQVRTPRGNAVILLKKGA